MKSASDHLSALTQLGNRQSFQSGSLILEEGEAGGALYLLQSGVVRSYSQSPSGKVLVHNRIQAGEFFGEMALDGGPRSASVQALTDCECVLVPPAQVLNYMREQLDFAYADAGLMLGTFTTAVTTSLTNGRIGGVTITQADVDAQTQSMRNSLANVNFMPRIAIGVAYGF